MFQQPSEGSKFNVGENVGSLVLIWVREIRDGITTPYGEKEALACDVHVLDGAHGGEKFENTLIFQGVLIGSLRSAIGGDPVLARIGQGVAKPGQSAPFVLQPFTEADAKLATGYIQRMPKPFQAPANGNGTPPANPQPAAGGAPSPAAATPSASTAGPASGNPAMTPETFATLPAEVQELLRQSGQLPAGV